MLFDIRLKRTIFTNITVSCDNKDQALENYWDYVIAEQEGDCLDEEIDYIQEIKDYERYEE